VDEFADYTLELYSASVFGRRYTDGECNTTSCADKTTRSASSVARTQWMTVRTTCRSMLQGCLARTSRCHQE
jgi:hypothetical protein